MRLCPSSIQSPSVYLEWYPLSQAEPATLTLGSLSDQSSSLYTSGHQLSLPLTLCSCSCSCHLSLGMKGTLGEGSPEYSHRGGPPPSIPAIVCFHCSLLITYAFNQHSLITLCQPGKNMLISKNTMHLSQIIGKPQAQGLSSGT